jgi:hypothetical protein
MYFYIYVKNQSSVEHGYGVDASRVGERRMKKITKMEKDEIEVERELKPQRAKYFPFCVHLAAIVNTND